MPDQIYQRCGGELVPVDLAAGSGLAPDALEITADGILTLDTAKAPGVSLAINDDGILEAGNE